MRCLRVLFREETALLSVRFFPFVSDPSNGVRCDLAFFSASRGQPAPPYADYGDEGGNSLQPKLATSQTGLFQYLANEQ